MRRKSRNTNVFPAPAGVIPRSKRTCGNISGFPRTCGGDPINGVIELDEDEFSPHLRG